MGVAVAWSVAGRQSLKFEYEICYATKLLFPTPPPPVEIKCILTYIGPLAFGHTEGYGGDVASQSSVVALSRASHDDGS